MMDFHGGPELGSPKRRVKLRSREASKTSGKIVGSDTKKLTLAERWKASPGWVKIATPGAAVLVVFGLPIVGLGVGSVAAYQLFRKRGTEKYSECMTPERIKIYELAIATLKDSRKLRVLADEFEKQGCKAEAEHLRKRAALRDLPAEQKAANKKLYKQAMASKNVGAIAKIAAKFESLGADGAAEHLRLREKSLRDLKAA